MGIKYLSRYHGGRVYFGTRHSKSQLEDAKIQEIKGQIKEEKAPENEPPENFQDINFEDSHGYQVPKSSRE
jgi:hypothetical protein